TAWAALSVTEQDEALATMQDRRLARLAGEDGVAGHLIRSLVVVRDAVGRGPTIDEDRQGRAAAPDEALAPVSRGIAFFGSWREAQEALGLADGASPRAIQARFASRRLGKVWKWSDDDLRDAVRQCVADLGRVPRLAEYGWWRQQQLDLAASRGEVRHIP